MLPPLFPSDISEPVKQKVDAIESSVRGSMSHAWAAFHSSLWIIAGVVALVFGSLGTLVVVVLAMGPQDVANGDVQYHGNGSVRGVWTDYYYVNSQSDEGASSVFDEGKLKWSLDQSVKGYDGVEFGVVVVPVAAEGVVELQSDRVFAGASTTKVLTAAAILAKVDSGELQFDSLAYQLFPAKKDDEKKDAEESESSPSASPTPKPKNVTIEEALRLMINRSDNVAWEKLIEKIGPRNLLAYATDAGMRDYNVYKNEVSPRDMAVLLQKLYRQELLTESSTRHLLALMQNTNEEQMIPAAMDSVGNVYHKYGWIGNVVHDVAIVENAGNPVVVVIMTEGRGDYATRKAQIREVAELIEQELGSR